MSSYGLCLFGTKALISFAVLPYFTVIPLSEIDNYHPEAVSIQLVVPTCQDPLEDSQLAKLQPMWVKSLVY